MKSLYYIFILLFALSCGNRHEKPIPYIQKTNNDSSNKVKDSIDKIINRENEKLDEEKTQDSISKHIADSLIRFVKYIKQHEHITINQRIIRIQKLYNSIGVGSLWNQGGLNDYNIDANEIEAHEIGLLLTDTNIINYNIDDIFSEINKDIVVSHSDDNRLWVVNVPENDGGTAYAPENIISWRDTHNVPKGFITSYTEGFDDIGILAYFYDIYKLKYTSSNNLYLLIGFSKGVGNIAYTLELNQKSLNWKYRGFKTTDKELKPINGRAMTYYLGSNYDDNVNYKFDTTTQTIKFKRNSGHHLDSIIKETLTFNGKYFEEKISKKN